MAPFYRMVKTHFKFIFKFSLQKYSGKCIYLKKIIFKNNGVNIN